MGLLTQANKDFYEYGVPNIKRTDTDTFANEFMGAVEESPYMTHIQRSLSKTKALLGGERLMYLDQLKEQYPDIEFKKPMYPSQAQEYARETRSRKAINRERAFADNSGLGASGAIAGFAGSIGGTLITDPFIAFGIGKAAVSSTGAVVRGFTGGTAARLAGETALVEGLYELGINSLDKYGEYKLTGEITNLSSAIVNVVGTTAGAGAFSYITNKGIISAAANGQLNKLAKRTGFSEATLESVSKVMASESIDDSGKAAFAQYLLRNDPSYANYGRVAQAVDSFDFSLKNPRATVRSLWDAVENKLPLNRKKVFASDFYEDMPIMGQSITNSVKAKSAEYFNSKAVSTDPRLADFGQRILKRNIIVIPEEVANEYRINGTFFFRTPDSIYISEGLTKKGSKETYQHVVGHEFYHTLKAHDPRLVRELASVMASMDDASFTKLVNNTTGPTAAHNKTSHVFWEEFMADTLGNAFESRAFWDALSKNKNKELQSIVAGFLGTLDKEAVQATNLGNVIRQRGVRSVSLNKWNKIVASIDKDKQLYTVFMEDLYRDLIEKTRKGIEQPIPELNKTSSVQKGVRRLKEATDALRSRAPFSVFNKQVAPDISLDITKYIDTPAREVAAQAKETSLSEPMKKIFVAATRTLNENLGLVKKYATQHDISKLASLMENLPEEIQEIHAKAFTEHRGDPASYRNTFISEYAKLTEMKFRQEHLASKGRALFQGARGFKDFLTILTGDPKSIATGSGNSVSRLKKTYVNEVMGPLLAVLENNNLLKEFATPENNKVVSDIFRYVSGGYSPTGAKHYDDMVASVGEVIKTINTKQAGELFNAGGIRGAIKDYVFPTIHNARKLRDTGKQNWVADVKTRIDREATLKAIGWRNLDNLSEDEFLNDYLGGVFDDIVEGRVLPEDYIGANLSTETSKSRSILFRKGEEYEYDLLYGSQNPGQHFISSITRRAETIAVMETIGPKVPELRNSINDSLTGVDRYRALAVFDQVTGALNNPANQSMADTTTLISRLTDMALLGKSGLTALFSDPVNMTETLIDIGVPSLQAYNNLASAVVGAAKRKWNGQELDNYFSGLNIGLDAVTQALSKRIGGEVSGYAGVGRLHSKFFVANGLSLVTSIFHEAMFDVTQQHIARSISDFVQTGQKNPRLWEQFQKFGITENELKGLSDSISSVKGLEQQRISPLDVANPELRRKLTNLYEDNMRHGVIEPDEASVAYNHLGMQAGTPQGTAARMINKYMSFEIAMLRQVYNRFAKDIHNDRQRAILSVMRLAASSYGLYFIGSSVKDLLNGKEPRTDKDRIIDTFFNSGILPVLPTIMEKTNLDNLFGLDDSQYGFLGPTASTATKPFREADNFYGFTNSLMGLIPFNNLPVVHESKKVLMASIFDDWYGEAYHRALRYQENKFDQDSIFLPDDE